MKAWYRSQAIKGRNLLRLHLVYKEVRSLVTAGSKIDIEHIKDMISAIIYGDYYAADLHYDICLSIVRQYTPMSFEQMLIFELVLPGRSFRHFWQHSLWNIFWLDTNVPTHPPYGGVSDKC